jgi:maleamate amidohydrolase
VSSDLTSNYSGVYEGRIGFGKKPALILIDFVAAYFEPESPLYADFEAPLAAALTLREAARDAGVPVIHTQVVYHPSLKDGGRFAQKVAPLAGFARGHRYGEWAKGAEPREDELVVSKQYASAFFGTSLASTLTAAGHDSLLITGLTTSGCIRASCVDCCSHGFIPIVVEQAVGDRHEAPHRANLFDMNAKYGDVVSLEDALASLNG